MKRTFHFSLLRRRFFGAGLALALFMSVASSLWASSQPVRSRNGMVASQKMLASEAGLTMLKAGGSAVDAAVATAFALAVTLPRAGNIGGGGFLVFRAADGQAETYDFREAAPKRAHAQMFLENGEYSWELHHNSGRSVGVPGTVAGLYLAWEDHGRLPWKRLVQPAIELARKGFLITDDTEQSFQNMLSGWNPHDATEEALTNNDRPYRIGDRFIQRDLAQTLTRIADEGPKGFYEGETARLIVEEMERIDGWISLEDLKNYRAIKRDAIRGSYRGYEIVSMPPPSSGGIALVQMLNMLENYELREQGPTAATNLHLMAESMRRAFSDRARYLGDFDFNPDLPVSRLISKEYADELQRTIDPSKASASTLETELWSSEHPETTHFSAVDRDRNAISMTYTIERPMTMVTGAGFLLNSELGDFNAGPGITDEKGLIGTSPNLAAPGKRPLSSMSPTIMAKDGELFMVTGTPGGRTIINTVLQTILNVVDFDMNAQQAIDSGRIHHQWFPDTIRYEKASFSTDTLSKLTELGHLLQPVETIGCAQIIIVRKSEGILEGGSDRRRADGGVAAY